MEKENAAKFWSFFEPYSYDFKFNFDFTIPCMDGSYLEVEFIRGYNHHSCISNVLMQSIRLAVTYKVAKRMVQLEECKDPNDTIDAVIEDTLEVLETSRKIQRELNEVIVLSDAVEEYLAKPPKLRVNLMAEDAGDKSEIGVIASVRWLADNRVLIGQSSEGNTDYCMRLAMFIDSPTNKDKHFFHRNPGKERCDIKAIYQAIYSNPPKNPYYDNMHKINMKDWCKFITMLIGDLDYRRPDAFE